MTKWILFIYGKEKSTYKNKLMTQYINRIQGEKKKQDHLDAEKTI